MGMGRRRHHDHADHGSGSLSKPGAIPDAVMEWGPTHAVVMDLTSKAKRTGVDLGEAAAVLNGKRDVVAAVSRRAAFVRAIRVPNVSKAEVSQILRLQLAGLFPVPESELAYDFRLTDNVDADGRLAVVGAMREADLLRLHAEARANGLRIQKVLPAAFGSMMVARELGLPNCAVVQPTVEGIAIDIIADGELRYTRVTPASSDASAVEAEIMRTFAAAGVEAGPIVATEGIHLPHAIDARTTPLEALGTAGAEMLHLNLEPAEVMLARERRRVSSRARVAALMCIAALLLAAYVFMDRADKQAAIDKLDRRNDKTLADLRKLRDAEGKKAGDTVNISHALTQAFQPGQSIGDVLSLVTNDAPTGVWLVGINEERGRPLTLRGTALNGEAVNAYYRKLTAETERLREVKLVTYNDAEIDGKPVVQFAITAFPVGNTPVSEPKTKGAKKP